MCIDDDEIRHEDRYICLRRLVEIDDAYLKIDTMILYESRQTFAREAIAVEDKDIFGSSDPHMIWAAQSVT